MMRQTPKPKTARRRRQLRDWAAAWAVAAGAVVPAAAQAPAAGQLPAAGRLPAVVGFPTVETVYPTGFAVPLPPPDTAEPPPRFATKPAEPHSNFATSTVEPLPSFAANRGVPPLRVALNAAEPPPQVAAEFVEPPLRSEGIRLADLSATAEASNPQLQGAILAVREARGRAVQAGLYPNPTFQAGPSQLAGGDSQYQVMLSQEVVSAGKLRLDQAAVRQEVRQAEWRYVQTRYEVLTNVRKLFFAALAAQERVANLDELARLAQRSKEIAERLQGAGEGTRADILLLDIELQRARMSLANSGALAGAARQALAATVGSPQLAIPRLIAEWEDPLPKLEHESAVAALLDSNAVAQQAYVEVRRRQFLQRRAEVEPIPNVTFTGGWQNTLSDDTPQQGMLWVSLPVPVWNKNQGAVAAASAATAKAAWDARAIRNDLEGRLALASGRYLGAKQQVELIRGKILPPARESFEIVRRGYEQGQFDFLRLLQAQKALIEARLDYVQALEDCWVAAAEAAGILQLETFP